MDAVSCAAAGVRHPARRRQPAEVLLRWDFGDGLQKRPGESKLWYWGLPGFSRGEDVSVPSPQFIELHGEI